MGARSTAFTVGSLLALTLGDAAPLAAQRSAPAAWQTTATRQSQPGRSCVVFVGSLGSGEAPRTDGDREMAGEEGIPLCDRMR
jgi:hypothetical protein